VTILTGFLGSGKTTLLNAALKAPALANTAVVVNELGDIGLDQVVLAQAADNVVLLDAGCLCCVNTGALHETLADLIHRRTRGEVPPFERVIIETSGAADPAPLLHILLGHPVEEVIVDKDRAVGLVAGGKAWRASAVVAGVNPKLLFDRLVPESAVEQEIAARMHGWRCESATFRMNVALSELPKFTVLPKRGDHLTAGIIIAPSLEYMDRAYVDARATGWSKQPVVEMLIPTTLDPGLAPKGKHVASLFCQHFRFDLGSGRSWDKEREEAADTIVATVDAHAPGFAASVIGRQIHSPLDLERRFGLIGGDIFHGKMSLDQLFSARPMIGAADYRMPLKGLYLCGSGAHPGGGVTGAPGHNAAKAILADRRPWRRRAA